MSSPRRLAFSSPLVRDALAGFLTFLAFSSRSGLRVPCSPVMNAS